MQCWCFPVLNEEELNVRGIQEINEKEILKDFVITTMTSGGKGGQNVNKVETSVWFLHTPTNINVKFTQERSQVHNQNIAMEILRGKLMIVVNTKKVDKLKEITSSLVDKWSGNQIKGVCLTSGTERIRDLRSDRMSSNANCEELLIESVWLTNSEG